MSEIKISGKISTHEKTFYGTITVDKKTGLITKVENSLDENADHKFGDDCVIFPGMGDVHIHAREDETGEQMYKEEYKTAGNAAINGGVVHVCAMPNTPNPVTTLENYNWHRNRVKELNHSCSILNYVGIGTDTEPIRDNEGKKVPYKVYTGPSVGDLFFKNEKELDQALQKYFGENISFHVEDFDILEECKNEKTHQERRPKKCVETALNYLLPLIEKYDINAKLCHWSIGKSSFEKIKEHRKRMEKKNLGYNTTVEVSPEHLVFDADMVNEKPELWPYVQMNPSIQSKQDRLDLIEGLRSGFIDYLATDHAPHTLDEKFKQFAEFKEEYPECKSNEEIYKKMLEDDPKKCHEICCKNGTSGVPWLDVYSLVTTILVNEHNFKFEDIARSTAYNPGLFVNEFLDESYGKGFGKIEEGFQGSLTVVNFKKPLTLKREMIQSKVGWSVFEGKTFSGQVEAVFVKGENVTGKFL